MVLENSGHLPAEEVENVHVAAQGRCEQIPTVRGYFHEPRIREITETCVK